MEVFKINRKDFISNMERLNLIPFVPEAVQVWADWIKECVELGQYADFVEQPKDAAIAKWFDCYYAEFYFIKKEFGSEIAAQLWALAVTDKLTLYPYEMHPAAEHLAAGVAKEELGDLIEKGLLVDDFHTPSKLEDVSRDQQNCKKTAKRDMSR